MKQPDNWGGDSLSSFIEEANRNTYATFESMRKQFTGLANVNSCFEKLDKEPIELKDPNAYYPHFFLLRAQSSLLAAARLAVSGQVYEVQPLLRTALESCLYGFHIYKNPNAFDVWANRCQNRASASRCKEEFSISKVKATLKEVDIHLHNAVEELYKLTIDYGAHPNVVGVASSWKMGEVFGEKAMLTGYLIGDKKDLQFAMKCCAKVGLSCLMIYKHVYKDHFDKTGINGLLDNWKELL